MVEVLVAALLMAVGIVALLQMFTSSSHMTLTSQREQAAMTAAEQAMETIRALPYASMALSTAPVHEADGNATGDTSGNPNDPNYWVNSSGGTMTIPTNFNKESSTTISTGETLITGGSVASGPTS